MIRSSYSEWEKEVERLEKQVRCDHKTILWDSDGKTGICILCGYTVKKDGVRR
jgi:hypothetical protein